MTSATLLSPVSDKRSNMCTVPEQSAIYALFCWVGSFLEADRIRNRLATVRDKCWPAKVLTPDKAGRPE